MKILKKYDPSDVEGWLAIRRQGIGGSDAAAVMGEDKWKGPYDVYHERVNPTIGEREFNEAAHWGNVLEDVVAQEFARRTGTEVRPFAAVFQHPDHDFMLATIDRLVYPPDWNVARPGEEVRPEDAIAFLEVKTRSAYAAKDWEVSVPRSVWWQVQQYLAVTGYESAWCAVLLGGQRFVHYPVPRDDRSIRDLIEAEAELWDRIQRQDPPPLDGSVESTRRLEREHAEATAGEEVDLADDIWADVVKLRGIKADKKLLEKAEEGVRNRIKKALGDAEFGSYRGQRLVSWSNTTQRRLDLKRLRDERPDIAQEYETEVSFRALRTQEGEDE